MLASAPQERMVSFWTMPGLADSVLALVSAPLARELRAIADLDEKLGALVRAGSDAHPSIAVEEAAWARYLARHLCEGQATKQLTELRVADVHLVLGCAAGHPSALRSLEARLLAIADQALVGIRLGSNAPQELLQDVRVKLLVGEPGQTKIESYAGRGALEGWLRVTLARTALSRLRTNEDSAFPSSAFEDEPLAELASGVDPHIELLRARSAPILKEVIEQTVAALPAGTRALLRLHVIDGLSIDDLAAVYHVHRATVARRIARARNEVFETARVRAIAALGIQEAEFTSLICVVMSQLDLTLHTMRAAEAAET